jgi:hypothetical protein
MDSRPILLKVTATISENKELPELTKPDRKFLIMLDSHAGPNVSSDMPGLVLVLTPRKKP